MTGWGRVRDEGSHSLLSPPPCTPAHIQVRFAWAQCASDFVSSEKFLTIVDCSSSGGDFESPPIQAHVAWFCHSSSVHASVYPGGLSPFIPSSFTVQLLSTDVTSNDILRNLNVNLKSVKRHQVSKGRTESVERNKLFIWEKMDWRWVAQGQRNYLESNVNSPR